MATQPFETRLSAVEQTLLELAQAQARTQFVGVFHNRDGLLLL